MDEEGRAARAEVETDVEVRVVVADALEAAGSEARAGELAGEPVGIAVEVVTASMLAEGPLPNGTRVTPPGNPC